MTSPSHKKRLTTPPSRTSLAAIAACLVVSLAASADDADLSQLGRDGARAKRLDPTAAATRWEELRSAYLRGEDLAPVDTPVPESLPQATGDHFQWTAVDEVTPSLSIDAISGSAPAPKPATEADLLRVTPVSTSSQSQWTQPLGTFETPVEGIEPAPAMTEVKPTIEQSEVVEPSRSSVLDLADESAFATLQLTEPADDNVTLDRQPLDLASRLTLKPLSSIVPAADYSPTGDDGCKYLCPRPEECAADETERCPEDIPLPAASSGDRYFASTMYHWSASNTKSNPLYFEDARLERYGQHIPEPIQSLKSVGLFAAQFASLPYQMALDPVHSDVSPLGFYRPGEAAPCLKRAVPLNAKAAATAAGAYTGLIFLVP